MTALITLVVLIFIVGAFLFYANKLKNKPIVTNHEKIIVLDDKNFNSQIKNKTILIDFWAEWCVPCKLMAPILNDLAAELPEGKYIGKIDIEAYPKIAQTYGIRNIPTLVLFKNGKEIDRFVGIKNKGFLKDKMLK